nr:MAG TPA: helix-turn-helix domain protein [Bacteriophage sp.]DAP35852.1 MAG TPA: helix-turn-helix domain protein [Caudoviricetes sp.]
MKDRFKELRKELNVTQQEFADKLKISRNFVAQIEMGSKVPSDRTIDDVCREFNVNEEWLRTGNGDMFIPGIKDKQISAMLADVMKSGEDSFRHRLVSALARLDDEGWDNLEKLIDMISNK